MTELDGILARLALSMGDAGARIGDENVRIEQEPENGLELRITILDDDGQPRSIASAFLPADEPPPAYPPDTPFLHDAGCHVIDDLERRVRLAMWRVEADEPNAIGAAFDRVVARSRESGWTLEERTRGRAARLTKDGRTRNVQARPDAGGAVVSMAERAQRTARPG